MAKEPIRKRLASRAKEAIKEKAHEAKRGLHRGAVKFRAADRRLVDLADGHSDPNADLTLGQRLKGAALDSMERSTFGRMGSVGRAMIWKRRGDKKAFRREAINVLTRNTVFRMGSLGDAMQAHFARVFNTFDTNPDIFDTIVGGTRPTAGKVADVQKIINTLETTAKAIDQKFVAVRKGFDEMAHGYRLIDKRLIAIEQQRNKQMEQLQAQTNRKVTEVEINIENEINNNDSQLRALGSQVHEHESKLVYLEGQIDFLRKNVAMGRHFPTMGSGEFREKEGAANENEDKKKSLVQDVIDRAKAVGGYAIAAAGGTLATTAFAGTIARVLGVAVPVVGTAIAAGGLGMLVYEYLKKQKNLQGYTPETVRKRREAGFGPGNYRRSGGRNAPSVNMPATPVTPSGSGTTYEPVAPQGLGGNQSRIPNMLPPISAPNISQSSTPTPQAVQSFAPSQTGIQSFASAPQIQSSSAGATMGASGSGSAVGSSQSSKVVASTSKEAWQFQYDKRGAIMDKGKLKARYMELAQEYGLTDLSPADAKRYGIDGSPESWGNFLMDLTHAESGFKPHTHGDKGMFESGSRGLFQLSVNDARNYRFQKHKSTLAELADPEYNARLAVRIAAHRIRKHGRIGGKGMGAYWGPIRRNQLKVGRYNNVAPDGYGGDGNVNSETDEMLPPVEVYQSDNADFANMRLHQDESKPKSEKVPRTEKVKENHRKVAGTRKLPLKPELRNVLEYVGNKAGVEFEITSGGQHRGKMTGTFRHNVDIKGTYGAADLRMFVTDENGKRRALDINNPRDQEKIQEVIHLSSALIPEAGIGANYMRSMGPTGQLFHIGGPNRPGQGPATWGNIPDWFKKAHRSGINDSKDVNATFNEWLQSNVEGKTSAISEKKEENTSSLAEKYTKETGLPSHLRSMFGWTPTDAYREYSTPKSISGSSIDGPGSIAANVTKENFANPQGGIGSRLAQVQRTNTVGDQGGILSPPKLEPFSSGVDALAATMEPPAKIETTHSNYEPGSLSHKDTPPPEPTDDSRPPIMQSARDTVGGNAYATGSDYGDSDHIPDTSYNPETAMPSPGDIGYGSGQHCYI